MQFAKCTYERTHEDVNLTRNNPELSMCKQKSLLYHKTGAACLLLLYLDAFDYNTGVSLPGRVPCIILQKRVERQNFAYK